ncbi:putative 115 kDa protein in type-1 retrotransposable element R1DM [Acropora cervicornis]|uniref:115 kDa protein in type-1 retrotransposable element R1DM n=1 Tax=Acropora cervicornis TaxID=6130 RepID=A0AAD9VEU2_ACRCE|nr:putative 115 kDa protein in type-1 retrotransposable element R1DM [Acropora cervicornis]
MALANTATKLKTALTKQRIASTRETTSPDEIINAVSKLKTKYSEGIDGINVRVIKAYTDLLVAPLSNICNLSLSTGSVPDKLTISKVLPVYKSDDKTNFTNNRPISILPCFSQILENFMYHRVMERPY